MHLLSWSRNGILMYAFLFTDTLIRFLSTESGLSPWQAKAMLICEICCEEVPLEEDMRTHLLLSHLENEMSCPLCSLSSVSYDELNFHISSAHPEIQDRAESVCGSPAPLKSRPPTGTPLKHNRDSSDGPKLGTTSSHSPRDNLRTTVEGVSSGTSSILTAPASQFQENVILPPAGATPVSWGSSAGGTPPISGASTSAVTTGSTRTALGSVKHCDYDKDKGQITLEHSKVKQKRMSSPRKGGLWGWRFIVEICL